MERRGGLLRSEEDCRASLEESEASRSPYFAAAEKMLDML